MLIIIIIIIWSLIRPGCDLSFGILGFLLLFFFCTLLRDFHIKTLWNCQVFIEDSKEIAVLNWSSFFVYDTWKISWSQNYDDLQQHFEQAIDYYCMVVLISAIVSARVSCVSPNPKCSHFVFFTENTLLLLFSHFQDIVIVITLIELLLWTVC